MASASARRSSLAKAVVFENKVRKQLHLTNLAPLYISPANSGRHAFYTDCLAASNSICTKRNMAWFGPLLFENKVSNNLQT